MRSSHNQLGLDGVWELAAAEGHVWDLSVVVQWLVSVLMSVAHKKP